VAIVDIRMPPTQTDEGLQAAREIREKHPRTGVLVLSQYAEPGYALELLQESAEGVGYLLKDRINDVPEFTAAVRRVASGGSALDAAAVSQLVGRRRRDDPLVDLSPREREVLELMAEGLSNQAIARGSWSTRAVSEAICRPTTVQRRAGNLAALTNPCVTCDVLDRPSTRDRVRRHRERLRRQGLRPL
jgi:FixJ family two-component response regulator